MQNLKSHKELGWYMKQKNKTHKQSIKQGIDYRLVVSRKSSLIWEGTCSEGTIYNKR